MSRSTISSSYTDSNGSSNDSYTYPSALCQSNRRSNSISYTDSDYTDSDCRSNHTCARSVQRQKRRLRQNP